MSYTDYFDSSTPCLKLIQFSYYLSKFNKLNGVLALGTGLAKVLRQEDSFYENQSISTHGV